MRIGLPVGHENVWHMNTLSLQEPPNWGRNGKFLIGDVSWLAAPQLSNFDGTIIHLVRYPLLVARSMIASGLVKSGRWEWITRFCPKVSDETTDPNRALAAWIGWNRLIEKLSIAARFTIDEVSTDDGRKKLLEIVGSDLDNFDHKVPFNWNTLNGVEDFPMLTWDDVRLELACEAKSMIENYGLVSALLNRSL